MTGGSVGRDANVGFATAVVDEWVRAGLTHAVVSPGSRSTPLALALVREPRLRTDVVVDERSAAFRALGVGRATQRPAVVLCTSGTAAVNLHPAVVEASYGRVPLLVCTADRPPELHDVGAPQTIDQHHLFGGAARWFAAPGPPEDAPGAPQRWRSLAARAYAEAVGAPPGPVHLDLAFREPLVPTGAPPVPAPGRPGGAPWHGPVGGVPAVAPSLVERLVARVRAAPRGLLVVGGAPELTPAVAEQFVLAAGWPLVADATSGLRSGPGALGAHEALWRAGFADRHRPDLVVRVGAPPTSKVLGAWLDPSIPQVLVDPHAGWRDPEVAATERLAAVPDLVLRAAAEQLEAARGGGAGGRDEGWLATWLRADRAARVAIDGLVDGWDAPFEGRVARDVASSLPDGSTLLVASSMPVRDLDAFLAPRSGLRVLANRGANGIDGFVSTVLGAASAGLGPTVGLLGDLCFLHDTNGLLGAVRSGLDAVLVVVDNDGGGIFSFLPQAELPELERVFATPHGVDLVAVAESHGVDARRITAAADVPLAVADAIARRGVRVFVVPTDRAENVARHRQVWEAAARSLPA